MKTPTAKKRLIEIVDKLLDETMIEPEINLSFCNPFNKYADLDIEITVFLSFDEDGYYFRTSTVNVTKFDMLDDGGDRVLSNEQEKDLIKVISHYIFDYYNDKGKRHI